MRVYKLNKDKLQVEREINHSKGIKCATFAASLSGKADMAFGDFNGDVNIIDLETG